MSFRAFLLLAVLVPPLALADSAGNVSERRRESHSLVSHMLEEGDVEPSVARIKFLGQERVAALELSQVVSGANERARRTIALALAALAVPQSAPALESLATDADGATRMSAVQGLGRLHSHNSRLLVPLLHDKTLGVRREAATALGAMHERRFGKVLLDAARLESELDVRAALLVASGRSGDTSQADALESFFHHSSESTRGAAAQALVLLGAPRGLEYAKRLLTSPDKYERRQSVLLFEGAPKPVQHAFLRPLLDHPDVAVAASAARLLYQSGDRSMARWLVFKAEGLHGEDRLLVESEIDFLHLSDEERHGFLREAGYR